MSQARLPQVGDDGRHRLNCAKCGKLLLRFDPSLTGGPVEKVCERSDCRHLNVVSFNVAGPTWLGA